jgi:hypothetical protein
MRVALALGSTTLLYGPCLKQFMAPKKAQGGYLLP